MPVFEKDKKNNNFHVFWLTTEEALAMSGALNVILNKNLLTEEDIQAALYW